MHRSFHLTKGVWLQLLDGGSAKLLSKGAALEYAPVFSADGKQLAFIRHKSMEKTEVGTYDFKESRERLLYRTPDDQSIEIGMGLEIVNWTPDGKRLLIVDKSSDALLSVKVSDGSNDTLMTRPEGKPLRLSGDGNSLYLFRRNGVYKTPLSKDKHRECIAKLGKFKTIRVKISPDEKWLAIAPDMGIWIAPIAKGQLKDDDFSLLSTEGGNNFDFTCRYVYVRKI